MSNVHVQRPSAPYINQGFFIVKGSQVRDPIYVSVSKTDVKDGTSKWHESGSSGITWAPLTSALSDNTYLRPDGGYEFIVFKNERDTQRKGLYLPVDKKSVSITFNGWDDYGVMVDSVDK